MTTASCVGALNRLLTLLLEAGVALDVKYPRRLQGESGVEIVDYPRVRPLGGSPYPFASIDEYLHALRTGSYSAVLFDGAILQLGFVFRRGWVAGHRLAFLPCPLQLRSNELELLQEGLSLLDILEEAFCEGVGRICLRGALRFDFSPSTEGWEHSASHLHLSFAHCRIPVGGPLSLGHFIRFVFRRFYPETWRAQLALREWPMEDGDRTIRQGDESELHVTARDEGSLAEHPT